MSPSERCFQQLANEQEHLTAKELPEEPEEKHIKSVYLAYIQRVDTNKTHNKRLDAMIACHCMNCHELFSMQCCHKRNKVSNEIHAALMTVLIFCNTFHGNIFKTESLIV